MLALCPACGLHHRIVRVVDDGVGDERRDIYQIEPLPECDHTWLTDQEIQDALARFGQDPLVPDDDDD